MSGSGASLPQLAEYQNRLQAAGGETRAVLAAMPGAGGQVAALATQRLRRQGFALEGVGVIRVDRHTLISEFAALVAPPVPK